MGPPIRWEVVAPLLDQQVGGLVVPAPEGRIPVKQDIGNDAQRPHVALLVVAVTQHFRRDIVQGAASGCERHIARDDGRQAEVDELHPRVRRGVLEAEVLEFQISMADAAPVAISDSCGHLPDAARCVTLGVSALPAEVSSEVRALHPLHDEPQLARLFEDLEQPADVGVVVHHQLVLHLCPHSGELLPDQPVCAERFHRHLRSRALGDRRDNTAGHARAENDAVAK
mmetsp:Transcript_62729/g.180456  ORF Transcript_62729/g.180456 Transcript_62729/m.180456 type:complete len:227 (+) Transcript_62729:1591-2271(+)